jgi:hypothetical protein
VIVASKTTLEPEYLLEPSSTTWWRRASALLTFESFCLILLVLTGAAALCFAGRAIQFLPVIGENVYPETAGVWAAKQWTDGAPLYGDYRQPPYSISSFPPLYYAVLAGAARFGASGLDSLTFFGRLLSLASLLGIAVLGLAWNRRRGHSWRISSLTPAFYLSFPVLIPWAVAARPDFPPLLLGFVGLYFAAFRHSRKWLAAAGVATGLAFLMRHNAVAVPVALVLWLIATRRWKNAILFCSVWFLTVVPVLLWFYGSSHGMLLLNLSSAKYGPFALTYARDAFSRLLELEGQEFGVALFAFGAFGFLMSLKEREPTVRLLQIYVVVALALAVIGTAAAGGGPNHYLEAALAMALLVPPGMASLQRAWIPDSPFAALALVLTVAFLVPALDVQRSNVANKKPEDLRRVLLLLKDRSVFTDDGYLEARTSKPEALDLSSLSNTARVGGWAAWDSGSLVRQLQQQEFDTLILRTRLDLPFDPRARYPRTWRLDAAIRHAIAANYMMCTKIDNSYGYGTLYVYTPLAQSGDTKANCARIQAVQRNVSAAYNNPTE